VLRCYYLFTTPPFFHFFRFPFHFFVLFLFIFPFILFTFLHFGCLLFLSRFKDASNIIILGKNRTSLKVIFSFFIFFSLFYLTFISNFFSSFFIGLRTRIILYLKKVEPGYRYCTFSFFLFCFCFYLFLTNFISFLFYGFRYFCSLNLSCLFHFFTLVFYNFVLLFSYFNLGVHSFFIFLTLRILWVYPLTLLNGFILDFYYFFIIILYCQVFCIINKDRALYYKKKRK
jgi:hypothetical protein